MKWETERLTLWMVLTWAWGLAVTGLIVSTKVGFALFLFSILIIVVTGFWCLGLLKKKKVK